MRILEAGIGFDATDVFSIEFNHHMARVGNIRRHTRFDMGIPYMPVDHDCVFATGPDGSISF